jgi:proton-translocating NADH-quinone oxidoreductase chain N
MNPSNAITWLIAIPLCSSALIYLIGRICMRFSKNCALRPAKWLAVIALLATAYPLYIAGSTFLSKGPFTVMFNSIALEMDGIALLLAVIVVSLGLLATIFSATYMHNDVGEEKFYALLTALIGSIIGLGLAADLFNLWVWFEAMTITGYTLVAFYQDEKGSLEAGVKYLVQSAAGSVLVLMGIVLVFMQTGSVNMAEVSSAVNYTHTMSYIIAGALFIIGFGVKTALVPLHTWLPDAHSQAPSGISAMLSGVVIEAGLVALLRSVGAISNASGQWGIILLVMGALNIAVGNMMALRQTEVKRLLAYSSISHVGYMLIGFGATMSFGSMTGAAGGFFHMTTHAMMKGLAFFCAGTLLYVLHLANGDHSPLTLDDLNGVSKKYPIIALAFSIAVLALGGLPPLAGFMSKWQIFVAGFGTGNGWVQALVIFAAFNSVISLGYYAPLVNRMYRKEPSTIIEQGKPVTFSLAFPIVILTILVIVIGFYPAIMSWITQPAGISLLTIFGA